jgi:hypothetical protein
MKALHLTDEEIQEYILDRSTSDIAIVEHAGSCEDCRARITTYQLLFDGLKQQSRDVFDFNLAELVVAQLPSPASKPVSDNFFVYLFVAATLILGGVALYYFRNDMVSFFRGTVPLLIYLTITTVITLLIILSLDMYKTYHRKMKSLDFI